MNSKYKQLSNIFLLLFAFIIYSSTSIFMKLASYEDVLSYKFFMFYSMAVIVLGIYAIIWQIVLKRIPLTIAFMSKSITIVFAMLIARFIFSENISINNIIGAGFVIIGIILLPFKK